MRKLNISLWLLCLFTAMPFGAKAQRTLEYSLAFSKTDFSFQSLNGDTSFITSTKYDVYSDYDPLQPDLPVIYVSLLLPPNASYAGMSFTPHPVNNRINTLLTNGHAPATTDMSSLPDNNQWYPSQTYYESVEFAGSSTVGGYRTVTLKVKPCRYYSARKNLFFFRFDITIQLNDADVIPLRTSTRGARERSYVESKIWNKEALDSYVVYPSASQTPDEMGRIPRDRYIIITNNSLKDAFGPLAEWKRLKGLDTQIITTEEIYANTTFSADTGIQKIKHYLKNEFESTNVADKIDFYVLLGGDVNIVPSFYCISPSEDYRLMNPPCDMYYACVSGNDWKWNSFEYGMPSGENFYFFNDLFVARVSAQTPEHVSVFINKIIHYEINPPVDTDWGNRTLFIGERIRYPYFFSDTPHDVELYGRAIIEASLDSVKQSEAKYLFSSASNIYSAPIYDNVHDRTSYIDSLRYATQIAGNYSVINQISHGSHSAWGCFKYIPDSTQEKFYPTFDRNSANTIVSTYPKVIISAACQTNEFDIEYDDFTEEEGVPSLSECLMRNPNSGVVAYVGSSKQGISQSETEFLGGQYLLYSMKINYRFMEGLYSKNDTIEIPEDKKLGKIVDYAKKGLKHSFRSDGYDNYLLFAVNTLGDPEMPLYTTVPQQFENVTCHYENDSLFITMDSTMTAYVQFSGAPDNLFVAKGNTSMHAFLSDSVVVTLKKQNFIPKVYILYSTDYIQNHTFNQNYTDNGYYQYIHVGRNVTDKKTVGNVSVGSGKTVTLKAQKGVYIKNGFTNPLGSTFEIDIDRAE